MECGPRQESTSCRFQSFINCLPVFCRYYHSHWGRRRTTPEQPLRGPYLTLVGLLSIGGEAENTRGTAGDYSRFPFVCRCWSWRSNPCTADNQQSVWRIVKLCFCCRWQRSVLAVVWRPTSESKIMQIKLSNRSFSLSSPLPFSSVLGGCRLPISGLWFIGKQNDIAASRGYYRLFPSKPNPLDDVGLGIQNSRSGSQRHCRHQYMANRNANWVTRHSQQMCSCSKKVGWQEVKFGMI